MRLHKKARRPVWGAVLMRGRMSKLRRSVHVQADVHRWLRMCAAVADSTVEAEIDRVLRAAMVADPDCRSAGQSRTVRTDSARNTDR